MKWKFDVLKKELLKKNMSTEDYPFGPEAAVFKVMGKMFALIAWDEDPMRITLKCDPAEAQTLRSIYDAVKPGYYMNKAHWNTITLDGSMDKNLILEMVDESYALVAKRLKKSDRVKLGL